MTENLYTEFDEIINLRQQISASTAGKYKELLKDVKKNTSETKYGTKSLYLGYFCPSLVMDKTVGGFKKGIQIGY